MNKNILGIAELFVASRADSAEAGPIVQLDLLDALQEFGIDVGLQLLGQPLIDGLSLWS